MKPDEATLIDYLYGELDAERRAQVEAYLAVNPEAAAELADMEELREWVQEAKPQEEALPTLRISLTPPAPRTSWWQSRWLQAAAVGLLLMLTAAALDLRLEIKDRQMTLAFGPTVPTELPSAPPVIDTTLRPLLWQLAQRQDSLTEALAESEAREQRQFMRIAQRMQSLGTQTITLDPSQLGMLRTELVAENARLVEDLVRRNQNEHLDLTADMLSQLAEYLEDQRTQDLELMAIALRNVWLRQDEQHQETELLLTQLIEQVAYNAP